MSVIQILPTCSCFENPSSHLSFFCQYLQSVVVVSLTFRKTHFEYNKITFFCIYHQKYKSKCHFVMRSSQFKLFCCNQLSKREQKESKNTATNHSQYMDESNNIIFCFVLIIVTSSRGQNTDNKNNIPFEKKIFMVFEVQCQSLHLDPFSNQETTCRHKSHLKLDQKCPLVYTNKLIQVILNFCYVVIHTYFSKNHKSSVNFYQYRKKDNCSKTRCSKKKFCQDENDIFCCNSGKR